MFDVYFFLILDNARSVLTCTCAMFFIITVIAFITHFVNKIVSEEEEKK